MGLNGLNRLLIKKLIVFKFLYVLMLNPTAQQTQQIQQTQQHNRPSNMASYHRQYSCNHAFDIEVK